jgi:hypothetical protein
LYTFSDTIKGQTKAAQNLIGDTIPKFRENDEEKLAKQTSGSGMSHSCPCLKNRMHAS